MNFSHDGDSVVAATRQREQGTGRIPQTRKAASAGWRIAGLLLLSALPLTFGVLRLLQLAGIVEVMPINARVLPLALVLHIVGAAVMALLGAFQFAPSLRRGRRSWHRIAGRFVVTGGLLAGFSGLWITLFYQAAEGTGGLLYALRLLFGPAMVACFVLGFVAIRQRKVSRHRVWMTRGYAIGLGAATQMLTLMVGELILGPPDELGNGLLNGAGWVINLAVAEWALRKRPAPPDATGSNRVLERGSVSV